ncbi:hypothetical protein [Streptomyces sp. NPDC052701]|uniref:hypothetical protein n=1 Tax=Streptomyces sp. NPDC052701 TaxID=3155533 RepID=UPI00343296B0
MAVDQLPEGVREFADYLSGLLACLDQGGGWCAVFRRRDPDGMRACLDGREVPPWDVVEALLQDLAAAYGPDTARAERGRARGLHAAALAAYDARPGGRDALVDRLDVMLREQRHAVERQAALSRSLASAPTREEADALRLDLAWARDDHDRATARCAELRARLAEADRRARTAEAIRRGHREAGPALRDDGTSPPGGPGPGGGGPYGGGPYGGGEPAGAAPRTVLPTDVGGSGGRSEAWAAGVGGSGERPEAWIADAGSSGEGPEAWAADDGAAAPRAPGRGWFGGRTARGGADADPDPDTHGAARPADPGASSAPPAPAPRPRKRRRGGARFAGTAEQDAVPDVVPAAAVPAAPASAPAAGRAPRGARFAGAAEPVERAGRTKRAQPPGEVADAEDRREVARAVGTLARLRGEGRSGEAHALLAQAASWPAARFPLLAAEMRRAGLDADWATLLWEAASLPADRLVAAADALAAAGRAADGRQILRQGVARPADEIGRAVLGLVARERRREACALLDAYVRVRTPQEAARSAEPGPRQLVPLLLEAARGVSEERHWDLVHALRVAGFSA